MALLRLFRGTVAAQNERAYLDVIREHMPGTVMREYSNLHDAAVGFRRGLEIGMIFAAFVWMDPQEVERNLGPDGLVVSTVPIDVFDNLVATQYELVGSVSDRSRRVPPDSVITVVGGTVKSRRTLTIHDDLERFAYDCRTAGAAWSYAGERESEAGHEVALVSSWSSRAAFGMFATGSGGKGIYQELRSELEPWFFETYDQLSYDSTALPEHGPAMMLLDDDRIVTALSMSADRIFGPGCDVLVGRKLEQLLERDMSRAVEKRWLELLANGRLDWQLRFRREDDSQMTARCRFETDSPRHGIHACLIEPLDDEPETRAIGILASEAFGGGASPRQT